jgi:hypothetical protein
MAKKRKIALPKTVAGLKVPKSLRKSRLLRSLLASPLGRKVVADALIAGAGAAATVLMRERQEVAHATEAGVRKGGKGLALVTEAIESAAEAMMDVVTDAARSMLPEGASSKRKDRKSEREHDATRH